MPGKDHNYFNREDAESLDKDANDEALEDAVENFID
jgi:hypothetical protein